MIIHPRTAGSLKAHRGPPAQVLKRAHRHWEQGVKYGQSGDWIRAEAAFFKAVQGHPADPLYLLNLARSQMKNEELDKALLNANLVLVLDPENMTAREIGATCLRLQNRHEECAALWQQVPAHVSLTAEYYQNLGVALSEAGKHDQALSTLFEGLGRKMDHAPSHHDLALSFNALGLKQEATECLRTALILGMGQLNFMTQGLLTFYERELCRWQNAVEDLAAMRRMAAQLAADSSICTPVFAHATLIDDPREQFRVAGSCARYKALGVEQFEPVPPHALGSRLRVGFVSADFYQHATAHLMAEVFEQLDPGSFEVSLYSHGPDDGTPMRARLQRSGARFVDVARSSDRDVAQRIRDDGIEVLIDLKGHTSGNRLRVFAYRPAPVQVTFLGFPGTTGANYIDYFIGDAIVSSLDQAPHYSEKLALMPRCYQPNDRQRPRPLPCTREEFGLPSDGLVLCGFNQPFKLSPEVFDVWCRLLRRLPGSVLWLSQWNDHAPALLRAQAEERGVDPARLIFAPMVGPQQHMNRMALADLFIDTWPCNGHTTASDALWVGLPVITYTGSSFASRVAASLLDAVRLPELATTTLAAYEAKVIELAENPRLRKQLSEQLKQNRDTASLFDSPAFTIDFGRLLWAMAARWSKGLAPEHLDI
jgi:predicted O-linked N-acetylglucosamine transferase (SPINDLY family)